MIPRAGEEGCGFVDDVFDDGKAVLALHGGAHGFGEGFAVAGHVDFRNDLDVEPGAVGDEVAQFVLGVVFAWSPGGPVVFGVGELRVFVDLDSPGRVVREVEVKGVDFVTREVADECFDEVRGEVVTAYVEHDASEAEGGRVFHAAAGDDGCAAMGKYELAKCLEGVEVSGKAGSGYFDPAFRSDNERVVFLRAFGCRSREEYDGECLRGGKGCCKGESGGGGDVLEFCCQVDQPFLVGNLAGFHVQGGEGAGALFPFDVRGVGQERDFSRSCRDTVWGEWGGVLQFSCCYGCSDREQDEKGVDFAH